MQEWTRISLLLCVFGFLKEFRPSEPFLTDFLIGPWRNITKEQVNREVYPVATYSYAAQLVLVFLITDLLRYKPIIFINGCSGIIVWGMSLWTTSLQDLQILHVIYGTFLAAEVAYYTYIYAKVDKEFYAKVTSYTRAAILCGKLAGGSVGQVLIHFDLMDYRSLNYITFTNQIIGTIWVLTLPNVEISVYFHRKNSSIKKGYENTEKIKDESKNIEKSLDSKANQTYLTAMKLLWSHLRNSYTNIKVVEWSILYAAETCIYYQAINYIQILWNQLNVNNDTVWNGAVDATFTFFGALVALLAGYLQAGRISHKGSLLIVSILSIFEGGGLLLACWTDSLFVSYVGYVIFGVLYSFIITVSGTQVARHLEEDSFGLVFGINTFAGILLQVVMTYLVVDEGGLSLDVAGQFTVYAFYFVTIGVIYGGLILSEFLWKRIRWRKSITFSTDVNVKI